MQLISSLPVWGIALTIFCLRICDVSLDTVRIISVVQGRARLSVLLGFIETLIWITAISQVITMVDRSPFLLAAYASGCAAGQAVGMLIEKWLALGTVMVSMISSLGGEEIVNALNANGKQVTTIQGQGKFGPKTIIYAVCRGRNLNAVLEIAQKIDPNLFYTVETVRECCKHAIRPTYNEQPDPSCGKFLTATLQLLERKTRP
ncbi:MAG: DUF2179 domain-containing protein [Deltaproteobacteria bacterium]|nr:DUF2179 domain-containing protein [Deltaproteobacteria bacterium]